MTAAGTVLTAQPTPEVARRAWPQWLALGAAMLVVAGVSIAWSAGGARLLLGALGLFLAVRGAVLLRTAAGLDGELAGRARTLGPVAAVTGAAGVVVALLPGEAAARVLLVAVPLVLLAGALALLAGTARRAGQALGLLAVLVTGPLVATGVAQDWSRAADAATVVAAALVAVLAVPVLVSAVNLRTVAARPAPAPVGGGCGGCACGAGGCGA
ncbi:hypothetical protein [Blastococcus sp. SYSU D01042]